MAAAEHGVASSAAQQSTTSATYVSRATAAASNFTAGDKYLIWVQAKVNSTDPNNDVMFARMVHGSTEWSSSVQQREARSTGTTWDATAYNWFTVFTQPGTAEDVVFEQKSDGTATVTVDDLHIFWINLSDLAATAWKTATDTSGPTG